MGIGVGGGKMGDGVMVDMCNFFGRGLGWLLGGGGGWGWVVGRWGG